MPTTFYFLYDNENNIVGVFKLRHYLNDFYKKGPGHISYAIKKECRNKGYAKKGLHLAIQVLDNILPEEEKLIRVCCSRKNIGSFLTIQGNVPVITNDLNEVNDGKTIEECENYIERKNRILIRTLNEKDIIKINIKYLIEKMKNNEWKFFGAFYNNDTLIGYISVKQNEIFEIKNIEIIENENNLVYGLFNYVYAFARTNKIKKIIINEFCYEKFEKEFNLKEKYDLNKLENGNFELNVKQLYSD